jgi:hypothetical protein
MKKIIAFSLFLLCSSALTAQLSPEQQTVKKTFFDFLKFYQKNEIKFNSFKLYKGTGKENTPPYKIQWKEVDRYFAYLRTSVPFVGEAYIKAEKNHFLFSDSCFKADPEDELPAGFDYDRWAGGQESIEYTMKWYTSAKNKYEVLINGNTAELRIGAELTPDDKTTDLSWSSVPFIKEKGKWKMADNVYPAEGEPAPGNNSYHQQNSKHLLVLTKFEVQIRLYVCTGFRTNFSIKD